MCHSYRRLIEARSVSEVRDKSRSRRADRRGKGQQTERDATAQKHGREQLVLPLAQAATDNGHEPQKGDDTERREVEANKDGESVAGVGVSGQVLAGRPDTGLPTEQVDGEGEQHGRTDS